MHENAGITGDGASLFHATTENNPTVLSLLCVWCSVPDVVFLQSDQSTVRLLYIAISNYVTIGEPCPGSIATSFQTKFAHCNVVGGSAFVIRIIILWQRNLNKYEA